MTFNLWTSAKHPTSLKTTLVVYHSLVGRLGQTLIGRVAIRTKVLTPKNDWE
jgi:hypothetical protein